MEKRHEFMRAVGMTVGAEIPSWEDLRSEPEVLNERSLALLPIGIGYESD